MIKVAIPFHSGYGHTEVVANAVKRGVESEKAEARLIKIAADGTVPESDWEYLDLADAIIFGTPTYMGGVSAQFKIFADATAKPWFGGKWKDKLAGGFTNSGSFSGDKLATLQQLSILAAQHGMIWVSLGLLPAQPSTPHQRDEDSLNRLGSFLGLMTQSENDKPEITPPSGDQKTAESYGARIVVSAKRWKTEA